MGRSIFQRLSDWIESWVLPPWLAELLKVINSDILLPILSEIGQSGVDFLMAQIIAESKKDIPGADKIKNVSDSFKETFSIKNISDRAINLAIELLVSRLTKQGLIK